MNPQPQHYERAPELKTVLKIAIIVSKLRFINTFSKYLSLYQISFAEFQLKVYHFVYYGVRKLKKEEEKFLYEKKKAELEQEDFINAKKQAIILKAKEKGYSVKESVENGNIKLKLIKRIY